MQVENRGASCETCAYNGISRPGDIHPSCWLCHQKEGHPGWEPAPGVRVKETRWLCYRPGVYAPVPVVVREVI